MAGGYTGAGALDERLEVLELLETQKVYTWELSRRTWARAELSAQRNNFSNHGIGAAGVSFVLRRQDLTLGHALRWRGHHCFITGILPADRGRLAVEAALVEVSQCEYKPGGITFPAIMTEKYVRFEEPTPYGDNEYTHILVTPKAISLKPGKLVEVDGNTWHIRTPHTLDPNKNEYEIWREVEH